MLRPSRRSAVVVGGHDVGTPELVQLDPVLEGAQERVGLVQRLAVLAADVAAPGQVGQRAEGRAGADRLVGAAVHQLEQLDGELDVAQPARAQLELAVGVAGRDVLEHPPAHRLGVGDETLPLGGPPHHRGDHLDVLLAERQVAGHRPRLQQGLELPGLGPALVVPAVAGQGPAQRACLALGTQRGVDLPHGALDGRVRADPDQVGRQLGRGAGGGGVVRAVDRLVHEDHVDVGDVVELVPAALAHRDHGQAHPVGRLPHLLAGDRRARPRGCRPRGRRARRRRRRRRGRGPGRGRRAGAAPAGTPPAARRRPPRSPSRLWARRHRGRRRRNAAARRGRRTPPGGSSRAAGR